MNAAKVTTYRAKGQGFEIRFNDRNPGAAVLWAKFDGAAELVPVHVKALPVEDAKREAVRIAKLPAARVSSMAVAYYS